MQASLGVAKSSSALLFVICSPVGPYYKSGFDAVKLYAGTKYVRAWPGGTGDAKIGGYVYPCDAQQLLRPQFSTYTLAIACTGVPVASNYAPGIKPQAEVAELGYAQNLWLFGPKHEITEVGTMNFFCLWRNNNGGTVSRACRRPTCNVLGSLTARYAALGTPLAHWDRDRDGARYATA